MIIFPVPLSKFVPNEIIMTTALPDNQINPKSNWSEDKEFVAELHDRVRRYEAGSDSGFSIEAARETLNVMKEEYRKGPKK